jgi:hypothetical protein
LHQTPWSFGFDSQTRGTTENRAPPCVKVPGSSRVPRSPDGWDQIPRWAGGWYLHQSPWSLPSPGWAPDPLMVGIRSPDGLVVAWACTSNPGVLGLIPKREEPGKTGRHPVLNFSTWFLTGPTPPREQLCNRYCSNKHTQSTQASARSLS